MSKDYFVPTSLSLVSKGLKHCSSGPLTLSETLGFEKYGKEHRVKLIEPFTRFSQESLFLPILNKQSYCYADSRFQKSSKMVKYCDRLISLFLSGFV